MHHEVSRLIFELGTYVMLQNGTRENDPLGPHLNST